MKCSNNKKIRNATCIKAGSYTFKSKLEKIIYQCLKEQGFDVKYEPKTYTLIDGFKPVTPFYDKETDTQFNKRKEAGDNSPRRLVLKSASVVGIRYTPDFYFNYKGIDVHIEAKGMENDVYYIKKKLFRRYLDTLDRKSIYFEIYTKKQLYQAIDIIKEYADGKEDTL